MECLIVNCTEEHSRTLIIEAPDSCFDARTLVE